MLNIWIQFSQSTMQFRVLPGARFVVWQMGEVVGCRWSLVIKTKETTNNYISILEQTLGARWTQTRTSHCLNHLQPHPEPQLSAHKPHKEQGWGWGGQQSEEPGEWRHGCSCSGHLKYTVHSVRQLVIGITYTDKSCNKQSTVPKIKISISN